MGRPWREGKLSKESWHRSTGGGLVRFRAGEKESGYGFLWMDTME